MKTLKRLLLTSLLGVGILLTSSEPVAAGRIGGPIAERITIPANQTAVFDIPFAAGQPAVVTVMGNGMGGIHMALHDGDGNSALGIGFSDRKTASMNVYREGLFRVEVRNLSPTASAFTLQTN